MNFNRLSLGIEVVSYNDLRFAQEFFFIFSFKQGTLRGEGCLPIRVIPLQINKKLKFGLIIFDLMELREADALSNDKINFKTNK